MPAPPAAPAPTPGAIGKFDKLYTYRDDAGRVLFYVRRREAYGGKPKLFVPLTFGRLDGVDGWHAKLPAPPRPLYGLDRLAKHPEATVILCEGEKAADAAQFQFSTHVCMTWPGGAAAVAYADFAPLRDRDVIVWPDSDEPGFKAAAAILERLPRAHVLDVADLPEGYDAADTVLDDPAAWLREHMRAGNVRVADGSRPTIDVKPGQIDKVATAGEGAILQAGLPVFQRGDTLARPVCREVPASGSRTTTIAGLVRLTRPGVIDLLSQAAAWRRYSLRERKWLPCDPPQNVADVLLSRSGQWRFPSLSGVISTPTLRRDGTILSASGYDLTSRLFHMADSTLDMPPITERPSKEDARAALAFLTELLTGFPFVRDVDRAVALSAIITPVVRGAMSVAPLHVFRASTAGSGKSYLADVAAAVATGRPCPVVAAGRDEKELDSRLVGLLLAGYPLISIDNVVGALGSDLLCQAVERPLIRLRALGHSTIEEIESTSTFLATGNNLNIRGDMTRRSLVATLDAQMERPERRTFEFDPVQRVLDARGDYVAACLTIFRAFLAAGEPRQADELASYNSWARFVRAPLLWLGCADPVSSMETARDEDPELDELREVMGQWSACLGLRAEWTLRAVVDQASKLNLTSIGEPTDHAFPGLLDALLLVAGERGSVNTKRLSSWLRRHENRIVSLHVAEVTQLEQFCFRRGADGQGGLARWGVARI